MRWAGESVDMPITAGLSRMEQTEASVAAAAREIDTALSETEYAVAAWQGPISAGQLMRLRDAAAELGHVVRTIGQENWEAYGHE